MAHDLVDTKQSFWSLSSIQLTSLLSVPVLSTSVILQRETSFANALITIVLANFLLWFIRLAMIKMSYNKRKSAIDLAQDFLGEWGGKLVGVIFLLSALLWFVKQADFSSRTLMILWPFNEGPKIEPYIQYSIIVGTLSTIFCAFGIKSIKWLSLITLPLLLVAFFLICWDMPIYFAWDSFTGVSISGLVLILGVNLALTVDMPTFFRHAHTKEETIKALTLIQITSLFLGIFSLYFTSIIQNKPDIGISPLDQYSNLLTKGALPLLILISTICSNVFNIYACSVGWEVLVPKKLSKYLLGVKEYAILGLFLTALFIGPVKIKNIEYPIDWVDNAEVGLCFLFIVAWIFQKFFNIRASLFEKITYVLAWVFSMFIITIFKDKELLSWGVILLAMPFLILIKKILLKLAKNSQ